MLNRSWCRVSVLSLISLVGTSAVCLAEISSSLQAMSGGLGASSWPVNEFKPKQSNHDLYAQGFGKGPPVVIGQGGAQATGNTMLDFLETSSGQLDVAAGACVERAKSKDNQFQDCVARALEEYADKLETRIEQLPPTLQNIPRSIRIPAVVRGRAASPRSVPELIRSAARQVRAARTPTQVRTVVRATVAVIRKSIALIRADDPVVAAQQIRQGNSIAGAIKLVENHCSRAVGL